jgi:low affinity Fe/Cu permease
MSALLRLSLLVERWCSHPGAVLLATLILAVWLVGGFAIGFSEGYLTFGTFLISVPPYMLTFFLLVAQARYTEAIQKKLDGLILAIDKADNRLIGIENCDTDDRK